MLPFVISPKNFGIIMKGLEQLPLGASLEAYSSLNAQLAAHEARMEESKAEAKDAPLKRDGALDG